MEIAQKCLVLAGIVTLVCFTFFFTFCVCGCVCVCVVCVVCWCCVCVCVFVCWCVCVCVCVCMHSARVFSVPLLVKVVLLFSMLCAAAIAVLFHHSACVGECATLSSPL